MIVNPDFAPDAKIQAGRHQIDGPGNIPWPFLWRAVEYFFPSFLFWRRLAKGREEGLISMKNFFAWEGIVMNTEERINLSFQPFHELGQNFIGISPISCDTLKKNSHSFFRHSQQETFDTQNIVFF